MANKGLRSFKYAKILTESASATTYGTVETLAGAIESKFKPNISEASLYSDDALSEYDTQFCDGLLTLGVDNDDDEIFAGILGNSVTEKELNGVTYKEVLCGSDDSSNPCGFAQIIPKTINGKAKFKAQFLSRVFFKPYENTAKTKGEKTEYSTPSVEGKVTASKSGLYERHATFDFIEDAEKYVELCFGKLHSVTATLTGCSNSNPDNVTIDGEEYRCSLTPDSGKVLPATITVKIGTTTLSVNTGYTYNQSLGDLIVPNVTGKLTIIVTATNAT